jgi:hypothetical protein
MPDLIDDSVQALENPVGAATVKDIYVEVERIEIGPLYKT